MIKLNEALIADRDFSNLFDRIETAYRRNDTIEAFLFVLAFFDRLFDRHHIDAVDITDADIEATPYTNDRVESVFNDLETGELKLRTENDNAVIPFDEVSIGILYEICKYLCNTDIIKIGVSR